MRYKKVSLIPGGGLEVTFTENTTTGVESTVREHKVKNPTVPHPDLVRCFDKMRPHLMSIMGINPNRTFAQIKGHPDATVKQKKAIVDLEIVIDEMTYNLMQSIEVRGISISGSDEKPKILISGVLAIDGLGKMALNTPNISLTGTLFGNEVYLLELYDYLMKEVDAYQRGKAAQLEMFSGED